MKGKNSNHKNYNLLNDLTASFVHTLSTMSFRSIWSTYSDIVLYEETLVHYFSETKTAHQELSLRFQWVTSKIKRNN